MGPSSNHNMINKEMVNNNAASAPVPLTSSMAGYCFVTLLGPGGECCYFNGNRQLHNHTKTKVSYSISSWFSFSFLPNFYICSLSISVSLPLSIMRVITTTFLTIIPFTIFLCLLPVLYSFLYHTRKHTIFYPLESLVPLFLFNYRSILRYLIRKLHTHTYIYIFITK